MERLRGLWRRSLFNLREILLREFFERVISRRHVDLATLPDEFLFGGEKPSNERLPGFEPGDSLAEPCVTSKGKTNPA